MQLSAVNSINWARVMAQIVYYVVAAEALHRARSRFSVPTGNFGNVLAGWIAREMGAPISDFVDRLQHERHPHPVRRRRAT